ncbi:MAG TPA: hypothetical protein DEA08_26060 [Planctomycetes bacterium]|nr:hypothetical protein [Planctomycetota bacterium]
MQLPATELALVYRLCGRLLLREVDAPALELLRQPPVRATLERAAPGAAAALDAWDDEAQREEFTRLFLLPEGVSPRASAWLPRERDTLGAGVARVSEALLAELGRSPDQLPGVGRLPRDHGALLLELAALALERDPRRGASFVKESLAPWLGVCGRELERTSRSPLYRALGVLLATLHPRPLPLCPEAS